jgi:hypothetical protein
LWCRIKEYSLLWTEKDEIEGVCSDDLVRLTSVGEKLLFFRKPFDNNRSKKLNFLPYFGGSECNDYIIKGT